ELAEYVFNFYSWSGGQEPIRVPGANGCAAPSRAANGILFLTHADTDLLTFHGARRSLPEGFPTLRALSLSKVTSQEHMLALLATHTPATRIVVTRLLGGINSVPGFRRLVETVRSCGQCLLALSGTGNPDPELTAASTVPPAILHEATAYLQMGGVSN